MIIINIGRNPDNDLVVNDETRTVSGHHAVLKVYDNGNLFICDKSTNGTFINGIKATKDVNVSVKKGDKIRLGPYAELDWSKINIPSSQPEATTIDTDEKASYTIGTASDNQIIISDPGNHVSRHHAILTLKTNGNYYIYDQSTNGTFVNGVKVKPKVDYPVSTSDTISLSNTYQLDWNKIPGVSVSKPVPPFLPDFGNSGTNSNGSKIWSYLLYAAIFLGIAYFGYYKTQDHSHVKHAVVVSVNDTVPIADPTLSETQTNNSESVSSNTDISTLYEQNKDAVFVIYTSDGTNGAQGSGFFISSRGVAVSNYHVFKGSSRGLETIKTNSGSYKVESVLASSEENDYIVFKVAAIGTFPYLKIAGSLPRVGEDVFAIGAPEGLEHTLSKGIVSSYRGMGQSLIQTTTEITHGSSGGPLFNMKGEVIGITTAGLGDANLNFAVNIVGMGFGIY